MSEVRVHIRAGCGLCGRTDQHTHPWTEWEAFIEREHGDKEKK